MATDAKQGHPWGPPLTEGGVRLKFRDSSRLESFIPPCQEVLTVPRRSLGCRDFGEPVLCKTNTRLLGSKIAERVGGEGGLKWKVVWGWEIF